MHNGMITFSCIWLACHRFFYIRITYVQHGQSYSDVYIVLHFKICSNSSVNSKQYWIKNKQDTHFLSLKYSGWHSFLPMEVNTYPPMSSLRFTVTSLLSKGCHSIKTDHSLVCLALWLPHVVLPVSESSSRLRIARRLLFMGLDRHVGLHRRQDVFIQLVPSSWGHPLPNSPLFHLLFFTQPPRAFLCCSILFHEMLLIHFSAEVRLLLLCSLPTFRHDG